MITYDSATIATPMVNCKTDSARKRDKKKRTQKTVEQKEACGRIQAFVTVSDADGEQGIPYTYLPRQEV